MNTNENASKIDVSNQKVLECIALLNHLLENSDQMSKLPEEQRVSLLRVAGQLTKPDRIEKRKRNRQIKDAIKEQILAKEKEVRSTTGIRKARETSIFSAPLQISGPVGVVSPQDQAELRSPRNCYVCKAKYTKLHHFYDTMCNSCGDLNYQKRFQSADLTGQVALITGSRLKIGYHATLMLLRAGATVIATTRFPVDSALRYSKEKDFSIWKERLHIYGLDLRHTPSVEIFTRHIQEKFDRLDHLINNAAQTVRRPPGFYAHLMQNENRLFKDLPQDSQLLLSNFHSCVLKLNSYAKHDLATEKALAVSWSEKSLGVGLRSSAQLSQIPYSYDNSISDKEVFPEGKLDVDLQQVDLRKTNSWRLKLGEIETSEMLELQLVNSIAPFVLCNRLAGLMKKENTGQKHIVNVTAMEGKFYRFKKSSRHPHTNMAKAALNMLTHTSAAELSNYGIFMNAVDTGWVTDEDPAVLAKFKEEIHNFQPPLDIVDGAARIIDPIFDGIITGKHWCGKFLKDYKPIDW
jgi:NAD(P)-dependent dehydrogenase (short-subunit alcohol dehydrogenase family)